MHYWHAWEVTLKAATFWIIVSYVCLWYGKKCIKIEISVTNLCPLSWNPLRVQSYNAWPCGGDEPTPAWAPCLSWGGECRAGLPRGAGATALASGEVSGCKSTESRGPMRSPHRCPPETTEASPSTALAWLPSYSSCSCWRPFGCAFECHLSSWWGAGWHYAVYSRARRHCRLVRR